MTIKEIADLAGVSTATVSYVMNDTGNISHNTRRKVLKIIEETNYKPNKIAKSLRENKSNNIGVLVEDITVEHVPEIINGINQYAEKHGFHMLLSDLRIEGRIKGIYKNTEEIKHVANKALNILLSSKVDGIIYVSSHERNIDGMLEEIDIPLIHVNCHTSNKEGINIVYDNEKISYEMISDLVDKGHHQIAIITGEKASIPSNKRLTGYCKALKDAEIIVKEEYICSGDWTYESGYKGCSKLFKEKNPPTAIYAMNDLIAMGVYAFADENGIKIPQDLSVVGFDNSQCSNYSLPKLTTVKRPLKEMGFLSAKTIHNCIAAEAISDNSMMIACERVEGDSVKSR